MRDFPPPAPSDPRLVPPVNQYGPLQPSATSPMTSAFDLTRAVCFEPFDAGRWFVLGFLAWLADLARGGPGFGGNLTGGPGGGMPSGGELEKVTTFVSDHLAFVIAGVLLTVGAAYGLMLLIYWLRSRADFAFLFNLAHNSAEISAPWSTYAREGNSLFFLRGAIFTVGYLGGIGGLGIVSISGYADLVRQELSQATVIVGIVVGLVLVLLAIGTGLLNFFIDHFVVPVMYARRCTAVEGVKEAWGLLTANFGTFLLYFLIRIVLAIGVGILVRLATCLTCCIAALPVIRCVVLLPVYVFLRGYSAYFVEQFGPQYRIFPETLYFDTPNAWVPVPPVE